MTTRISINFLYSNIANFKLILQIKFKLIEVIAIIIWSNANYNLPVTIYLSWFTCYNF